MGHQLFGRAETISNHGTQQGIVPRFQLQSLKLAKMSFIPNAENRVFEFCDYCLDDFTNFYDIHELIMKKHQSYLSGLNDGSLYNLGSVHSPFHDRTLEIEIRKHVKDFFIAGRQMLDNFAKSKFLDDDKLEFGKIIFSKTNKYEELKKEVISMANKPNYQMLFRIVDNYKPKVTEPFVKIRASFEHDNYKLGKFMVTDDDKHIVITEPEIEGKNFIEAIDFFYRNIFSYLEQLIVFFFGLYAHHNSKGNMTLFEHLEYDYSKLRYRYTILPKILACGNIKQVIKP
jgi:hypothetical protein